MYEDGFEASLPLYQDIVNPSQIKSLLTQNKIGKGAALMFMLESVVGENNFKQGLRVIF
jgi:aminopeptidase N